LLTLSLILILLALPWNCYISKHTYKTCLPTSPHLQPHFFPIVYPLPHPHPELSPWNVWNSHLHQENSYRLSYISFWFQFVFFLFLVSCSRLRWLAVSVCSHNYGVLTTTTTTVLRPLSGTTRVSWYQKKHSPTHHPNHHPIFISFFHLPWSIASSLFKLCAWQFFCTTSFHVLFGLPLGLEPFTSYSIHFFTQSVSSFCSTCPYHRSLFCCSINIISSIMVYHTVSNGNCLTHVQLLWWLHLVVGGWSRSTKLLCSGPD